MILKLFRGFWFLSVLAVLGNLLYVYASLPEKVVVFRELSGDTHLSNDSFFYIMTAVIALVNVLVYLVKAVFRQNENFRAWVHGLVICFNIFFIIGMSFIQVLNSNEVYNYASLGPIIYGAFVLVCLWAASWPVYLVGKRILAKPALN